MKRKFQFTRPQGARHVETSLAQEEPLVSIHAPARGATGVTADGSTTAALFQFTRPQGARLIHKIIRAPTKKFQFTRPQEARP